LGGWLKRKKRRGERDREAEKKGHQSGCSSPPHSKAKKGGRKHLAGCSFPAVTGDDQLSQKGKGIEEKARPPFVMRERTSEH